MRLRSLLKAICSQTSLRHKVFEGAPFLPRSMAPSAALRVVCLLPAATEMVCLVDGESKLVGRGHEDDFPDSITDRPIVTAARHAFTTSSDVDKKVSESLAKGEGLYFLDTELLKSLRPDVIFTQALCSVCAIDYSLVMRTARELDPIPRVVSLNPNSFQDILKDIIQVGQAIGQSVEAKAVVASLQQRITAAKALVQDRVKAQRPRVVFMEWTDPIFCGGHWTPQLIEMAGGEHPLNPCNGPGSATESFRVSPEAVSDADPDWVIVCPCGLDMETTKRELRTVVSKDWWKNLRAVKQDRVVLVDGNQMFNRSGPRIVDAFEWMVGLLNDNPASMPPTFPWEKWTPEALSPPSIPAHSPQARKIFANGVRRAEGSIKSSEGFVDPWAEAIHDSWKEPPMAQDIEEAHEAACQEGKGMYPDPETGYMVFSRVGLTERGSCCGNRCRHCPFGHYNVSILKGPRECTITAPTFMTTDKINRILRAEGPSVAVTALHWTGDISSYLALKMLEESVGSQTSKLNGSSRPKIVLCTFFDSLTGRVVPLGKAKEVPDAVSPASLRAVMDQALSLRKPLLAIPVKWNWTFQDVEMAIEDSLCLVPVKVTRLVMGMEGQREEQLSQYWALSQTEKLKGKIFFTREYLGHVRTQPATYSEEFVLSLSGEANVLGSLQTFWVHIEFDT